MSGIIKPGDAAFANPDQPQKPRKVTVSMFQVAGECPTCEMPVFVHTGTPQMDSQVFQLCDCEKKMQLNIRTGYDPIDERAALMKFYLAYQALYASLSKILEGDEDEYEFEPAEDAESDAGEPGTGDPVRNGDDPDDPQLPG